MKKLIVGLMMAVLAFGAQAQKKPSYAEARAIYDQIGQTLSRVMLWEKKTPQERRQAVVAATALRDKAHKLMGPTSQCSQAAQFHLGLITHMNVIVSASQGVGSPRAFDVLGMLSEAEVLGERKAACYDEVEALETAAASRQ